MRYKRSSGILLHITSLPSPYGIGDLGPTTIKWLDFLASAGCGLWQILPLGPTGYGDSPYQCFSSFAGNTNLISPDLLYMDGLIKKDDFSSSNFPTNFVDYARVIPWKKQLLDTTFLNFEKSASSGLKDEFDAFKITYKEWLIDFSIFMTIKDLNHGKSWVEWDAPYKNRHPTALSKLCQKYSRDILRHSFFQFLFFRQWSALHTHAKKLGIQIIGDIPIYVAHDSNDVWVSKQLFHLKKDGHPSVVAGVPPDYFTKTGQLWGNPLYNWNAHTIDGYSWWIKRLKATLDFVDIVRLDHFRGFVGYWEVPGNSETAEYGRWVPGPGSDFFNVIQDHLEEIPIIAEDLGVITPDVISLRDEFGFPGMKILQFAFNENPRSPFLPHNYPRNCVVYTGTHDNDTTRGWFERVNENEKNFFRRYLNSNGNQVAWDMIRACWSSVALFSIAPLQDFLNLGNEARMNYPGSLGGNWTWRVSENNLNNHLIDKIAEFNYLYDRSNLPISYPEDLNY